MKRWAPGALHLLELIVGLRRPVAAPVPVFDGANSSTAANALGLGQTSTQGFELRSLDDGGDGQNDEGTRFISSRAMIEALVNELLVAAGFAAEDRSTRLLQLASRSAADADDHFVLLVKFRVSAPNVWEYLPALGAYIARQVRARLGMNLQHVYWSLAHGVAPATKVPRSWVARPSAAGPP